MEIYRTIPIVSYPYRNRIAPLPIANTKLPDGQIQPYKTIREEAEEYKQKLRLMRLNERRLKEAEIAKNNKSIKKEKQKSLREHKLLRLSGLIEWWNDRIELLRYHCQRIKRNIIPTLFCLRAEVDNK